MVNVYFYPGWGIAENPKEWDIVKNAESRFEGHKPTLTPMFPEYSVTDEKYILRLIKFCEIFKIDSITICWYWDDGNELWNKFLDKFIEFVRDTKLKFSLMWVQRKPYKKFPLKITGDDDIYEPETDSRKIKIKYSDYKNLAEDMLKYLNHPNYLQVNNKYCITIFEVKNMVRDLGETTKQFISEIRKKITYHTNRQITLIGISHHVNDLLPLKKLGFDYTTSYVFLPDWQKAGIFDYEQTMNQRLK